MDLTDLTPEARPIVQRAAAVFVRHTQPWLGVVFLQAARLWWEETPHEAGAA